MGILSGGGRKKTKTIIRGLAGKPVLTPMDTKTQDHDFDIPARIQRHRGALTVRQLAEYIGLSRQKVYTLVQQGDIPAYHIGGVLRLDPIVIARWLRGRAA
jgi:excisionase family DNA binding protein